MQPNGYGAYNPQMQVRYMVPQGGYRQSSPPFANQAFDRYGGMQPNVRPNPNIMQPIRYPQGARPGYMPPNMSMMSTASSPRPPVNPQQRIRPGEQLQPPQPYYFNPNGPSPRPPPPKKGVKEYKDNAFTIAPDGAHSEAIKGLVSNNDINDLLKHKGTKVKVSKIYRITKTKPEIIADSSSDEELPPPIQQAPAPVARAAVVQRPVSAASSDSHCSTCSNCSCGDCRARERSHTYDDCPDCRAERERERARRQRRK